MLFGIEFIPSVQRVVKLSSGVAVPPFALIFVTTVGFKVLKYDLNGELIKNYNSVGEAYRDNTLPIWKFSKIPFSGEKIEIDGFLWSRNFLLGNIG